ncbi:ACP S-malonyltransferase [Spirulina sp. CS-785/01]|uniref:ACP S-malonyltransferase n=1 Tax=Spirulina sp. CS-785/01 TaxID=3021716 RepID=UPI00232CCB12|nr:ACP S-malonyltransferase [Spirulina sp. CS-785/01]MDB9312230.1 ACP S-malonyltransferase [Spirulina sp. CS-785/01]
MTKTAWVFPGQGSQKVGMQADLAEHSVAKSKFDQAQEILGWSVLEVCQSEDDQLSRTLYTQPSLYVIEAILADLLLEQGQTPQVVAGHSLGEYVALYAARVFDFTAGLKLVQRRSELMDQTEGGKMVALIGFDREQLQNAIDKNPNVVLANDNSKAQVVISGTPDAVEDVVSQIKTKRAVPLNVSGAFHSPLMQDASAQFKEVLDSVAFAEAKIPVLSNVNPTPSQDAEELKVRLVQQMTGSVRWREIMDQMAADGVERVLEVGPGQVLAGLFKRSHSSITRQGVSCAADIS